MNKILVAADGSAHADKALDIAASLGKQHGAAIIVLHAASNRDITPEIQKGLQIEYASEIERRLRSVSFRQPLPDEDQYSRILLANSDNVKQVVNDIAGENIVKRAASRLRANGIETIESYMVNGDPAQKIIDTAVKNNIDAIVMGCRGTGKLKGLLMGSVSQQVAHDAECTVIVVK